MVAAIFWLTSSAIAPEPAGLEIPPAARASTVGPPASIVAREEPPPAPPAIEAPEPRPDGPPPAPSAGSVIADTASHVLASPAPTPELNLEAVNQYLWNAYERSPVKRDQSGDFTWKDVAAAARLGMSRGDYVIRGMDPDFRELLYRTGLALDAAGIRWTILSGFRDDYRQGVAAGYKARTDNSLHGGSAATGGYGHGCAVDVIAPDHKSAALWKWIDTNGAQMGLQRPFPGIDPAHVLPRGAWHELAEALRHDRLTEPAEPARGRRPWIPPPSMPRRRAKPTRLASMCIACTTIRCWPRRPSRPSGRASSWPRPEPAGRKSPRRAARPPPDRSRGTGSIARPARSDLWSMLDRSGAEAGTLWVVPAFARTTP